MEERPGGEQSFAKFRFDAQQVVIQLQQLVDVIDQHGRMNADFAGFELFPWKMASKFCQFYSKRALKFSKVNFYLIDNKSMRILVDGKVTLISGKKLKAVFQTRVKRSISV
ncbi:MAG: hypothetical protein ACXV7J_12230 [Methylomonas sp.]